MWFNMIYFLKEPEKIFFQLGASFVYVTNSYSNAMYQY